VTKKERYSNTDTRTLASEAKYSIRVDGTSAKSVEHRVPVTCYKKGFVVKQPSLFQYRHEDNFSLKVDASKLSSFFFKTVSLVTIIYETA
jgi:hypothetical protein